MHNLEIIKNNQADVIKNQQNFRNENIVLKIKTQ